MKTVFFKAISILAIGAMLISCGDSPLRDKDLERFIGNWENENAAISLKLTKSCCELKEVNDETCDWETRKFKYVVSDVEDDFIGHQVAICEVKDTINIPVVYVDTTRNALFIVQDFDRRVYLVNHEKYMGINAESDYYAYVEQIEYEERLRKYEVNVPFNNSLFLLFCFTDIRGIAGRWISGLDYDMLLNKILYTSVSEYSEPAFGEQRIESTRSGQVMAALKKDAATNTLSLAVSSGTHVYSIDYRSIDDWTLYEGGSQLYVMNVLETGKYQLYDAETGEGIGVFSVPFAKEGRIGTERNKGWYYEDEFSFTYLFPNSRPQLSENASWEDAGSYETSQEEVMTWANGITSRPDNTCKSGRRNYRLYQRYFAEIPSSMDTMSVNDILYYLIRRSDYSEQEHGRFRKN